MSQQLQIPFQRDSLLKDTTVNIDYEKEGEYFWFVYVQLKSSAMFSWQYKESDLKVKQKNNKGILANIIWEKNNGSGLPSRY